MRVLIVIMTLGLSLGLWVLMERSLWETQAMGSDGNWQWPSWRWLLTVWLVSQFGTYAYRIDKHKP